MQRDKQRLKNLKVQESRGISMEKYILIGDSGHAKVIEDCIVSNGNQVIAKLDDKYTDTFKEGPYLKGPISNIYDLLADDIKVV